MLCHATGKSETHFPIVYRYNLLMFFSLCCVSGLNLAWNNIINGVCVLANCSECCVMVARGLFFPHRNIALEDDYPLVGKSLKRPSGRFKEQGNNITVVMCRC